MKKILILLIAYFFSTSVFAINEFKYLEEEVPGQFCRDILQELDFPGFPKNQKEPFKLITELIVEDIDRFQIYKRSLAGTHNTEISTFSF